jgi:hypothetical protein
MSGRGSQFTEERAVWLYKHYNWLNAYLPKRSSVGRSALVLPTAQFFPDRYQADHASAECLFYRVRDLIGMSDWNCRIEQRRSIDRELQADLSRSGVLGETSTQGAAGTFSVPEKEVLITYSAPLLNDPIGLVATFAHELCHYLLATVKEEPPATWKQLEPLTDLSAVLEGFGVFLCNSAFTFSQWTSYDTQGWSVKQKGYLTEAELGFALAIYCIKNRIDERLAARNLKPNPCEVFCDALDYILDLEDQKRS